MIVSRVSFKSKSPEKKLYDISRFYNSFILENYQWLSVLFGYKNAVSVLKKIIVRWFVDQYH